MPFQLVFQGGVTLNLNIAYLIRELGAPVEWHFRADLESDSTSNLGMEAALGKLLVAGPVSVKAVRQPGGITICPPAKVVSVARPGATDPSPAAWDSYTSQIDVIAQPTAAASAGISPFLPRRRVHKVKNMLELFDKFKHIAEPVQRLRAKLQTLEFPDKDKSSIIQDGISDWRFFGILIDQCRFLSPGVNWLPLTMVGGVDQNGGTAGKWVLTPGLKAPYSEWNDVDARKLSFTGDDGEERLQFGRMTGATRMPAFPSGSVPTFGIGRPSRVFDGEKWRQWSNLDLPRFTDQGNMVWRIQDCLKRSPQDNLEWETFAYACPPETQVTGPLTESRLVPWIGPGKVQQRDNKGPWIKVQFPGFESGSDVADVRLATPFSGTDGKKGQHFVPEQGTDVEVCWTGRFDASIVFAGNTRSEGAQFDSPSLYLEETHTAQYENVNIKRIGDVTIDSDLSMAVKQGTTLNSQQPLKVHADGADLKLNGGVVYTGRGF